MGFRTLIEVNHDASESLSGNPELFVRNLMYNLASGDTQSRAALESFGVRVVALRHSTDNFFVNPRIPGFPTLLPFDHFLIHRKGKVNRAREMLKVKPRPSRDKLENMITSLVEIIERLEEGETIAS